MKSLFLFLVFFLFGIVIVVSYKLLAKSPGKPITNIVKTISKPEFSIAEAPSESIKGKITSMTGGVQWQSRTANEFSETNSQISLQQGEAIQTEETGNVAAEFPNAASIIVNPKTEIDFIQTLPSSILFNIASGSAEIKKLSDKPISERAMHLLIKQNDGEVEIAIDKDKSIVNLHVVSGSITVSYNDLSLNSSVTNFKDGQNVSFNDLTRVLSF
jgi:hypothetical protein